MTGMDLNGATIKVDKTAYDLHEAKVHGGSEEKN
jgi:hypothetical protein